MISKEQRRLALGVSEHVKQNLSSDVSQYLADGGKIEVLPPEPDYATCFTAPVLPLVDYHECLV